MIKMDRFRLPVILLTVLIFGGLPAGCGSVSICGQDVDRAGTELLQNGDFKQGLAFWQKLDTAGQHEAGGHQILGTNRVQADREKDCGYMATFHREDSAGTSGLIGLEQPLSIAKTETPALKLQMILRIDHQQLASDGFLGGETSVFVTIDYQDAAGDAKSWSHGFLTENSRVNYPERDQTIAPTYWFKFDVDDLFAKIPDAARVTKVTVGGNGQDFHSRVLMISLLGK